MFPQKTACVDFSFNALCDRRFKFYDGSLVEAVKLEDPAVQEFFRLLALCHTVMPEEKSEGKLCTRSRCSTSKNRNIYWSGSDWCFCWMTWRKSGVPGSITWRRSPGHCSAKLWVCLPGPNARDHHTVWDGTSRHLPAARHTGLQQRAQENECHWLGLHL